MKRIFSLLLCFILLLSLTACGEINETSSTISNDENTSLNETAEDTGEGSSSNKKESSNSKDSSKANPSSDSKNKASSLSSKQGSATKNSSSNKAASNDNTSSEKRYPTRQKIITIRKNNQNKFKKIGRCDSDSYGLGIDLNWSCSSVEFNVDCKGDLAINFSRGSSTQAIYFEIYVDGKLIEERTKIASSGELTIATNLAPGIHNVKIVRQSDVECPTFTLLKILAFGNLADAPKDNPLYIEAIGDSSLIGWGVRLDDDFYKDFEQNQSEKQPIARNKDYQDSTLTYPYLAAQTLGADSYILARQGAGIAATYHKDGAGYCNPRGGLLPTMYDYMHTTGNKLYETTRLPDVFVIDAGSADLSKNLLNKVKDGESIGIDSDRAAEISTEFLKKLKTINPKAKIIWCYGLSRDDENLEKYISQCTKAAGGESKGIYTLKLPLATRGNGKYPAADYPSAKDHEGAAKVLVNKIKQITK